VIVYDGIDARVEVGEAVKEYAHRLVPLALGEAYEERDEEVDVYREPEDREHNHDQDEQHAGTLLLVRRPESSRVVALDDVIHKDVII